MTTPAGRNGGRKGGTAELGVFDLDAAVLAAQGEAGSAPFAFTWRGERYEVPPADSWPMSALDKLTEGELGPALTELIGAETYGKLAAAGFTLGALNALFDQVAKASGMEGLGPTPPPTPRATTRT
jgi:hypothetical protein